MRLCLEGVKGMLGVTVLPPPPAPPNTHRLNSLYCIYRSCLLPFVLLTERGWGLCMTPTFWSSISQHLYACV